MNFFLSDFGPDENTGSGAGVTIAGNGVPVHNNGHWAARTLVAGPGMDIKNPDLIPGKPIFTAAIQGRIAFNKKVACHTNTPTIFYVNMPGIRLYRITHVIFTNPTAVPSSTFRPALYTLKDKGGVQILPSSQAFDGMAVDLYSTISVPLSAAMQEARAVPYLYFIPSVVNPTELYMDVYVKGEVLEWEI